MRNDLSMNTQEKSNNPQTAAQDTARANLVSYLSELGFDPSKSEFAGLRTIPNQSELLGLIEKNLQQHGIESILEKGPNGWPHQEDVLVIKSVPGKSNSSLNRFADWMEQQMPDAKLFFDPLIGFMTVSSGSGSHWGICLPLSMAIEPENLWHPQDPTFGHELFHFLSASLYNSGVPVAFKVNLKPEVPFALSQMDDSGQLAEELLAHRFNLKHSLGRLARCTSSTFVSAEELDALTAVVSEIIFLGDFSSKTAGLIEEYCQAMLSDDRHVQLDYRRFDDGCVVVFTLPREDTAAAIEVWTRETTQQGVHNAMVNYFERLYSLSKDIHQLYENFLPKLSESKLYQHLGNESGGEYLEREPELVSLLQTTGKGILGLYKQNDFTLDDYVVKPNELFVKLREALEVTALTDKSEPSPQESEVDVRALLEKIQKLLGKSSD